MRPAWSWLLLFSPRSSRASTATLVPEAHTSPCYNDCFGRGSCEKGICRCGQGFSGPDCASGTAPVRPSRGFVFVYEVPEKFGFSAMRELHEEGDRTYASENAFMDDLMSDFAVRTLDPEKATLFYVPTWLYYYDGNVSPAAMQVERLKPYLQFWGKNPRFPNGEDHVFFFPGDKGACGAPMGPIYMSHWGLTVPFYFMGYEEDYDGPPASKQLKEAAAKRALEDYSNVDNDPTTTPCADARHIVVPPWHGVVSSYPPVAAENILKLHTGVYTYEMSFVGSIFRGIESQNSTRFRYSQGVRQLLWTHHHMRPNFLIDETKAAMKRDGTLNQGAGASLFATSRFCLAPTGMGFGVRLAKAVLLGCVPLIIQPYVMQPFEDMPDLVPYDEFSVRLNRSDIPRVHEILASITPEKHAQMRAALFRYGPAFSFHNGSAYHLVTESLRRRAEAMGPDALAHPRKPSMI